MNPIAFVMKLSFYLVSAAAVSWLVGFFVIKFFYPLGKEALGDSLTEVSARCLLALVKPLAYLFSFIGALGSFDLQKISGGGLVMSYRYAYGFNDYIASLISMFRASLSNITVLIAVFFSLIVFFRLISFYKEKK